MESPLHAGPDWLSEPINNRRRLGTPLIKGPSVLCLSEGRSFSLTLKPNLTSKLLERDFALQLITFLREKLHKVE